MSQYFQECARFSTAVPLKNRSRSPKSNSSLVCPNYISKTFDKNLTTGSQDIVHTRKCHADANADASGIFPLCQRPNATSISSCILSSKYDMIKVSLAQDFYNKLSACCRVIFFCVCVCVHICVTKKGKQENIAWQKNSNVFLFCFNFLS